MAMPSVHVDRNDRVVLSRRDFDELMERAGVLPALPRAARDGSRPAIAAAEAHIARAVVCRRIAAGLTQQELARRAGVRYETISRLEGAKHVPRQETILRIDQALREAETGKGRAGRRSRRSPPASNGLRHWFSHA